MDIGQSLPFYIIFCEFFPPHPYPNLPLTFPCVLEEAYSLSNKAALSERRVTVGADIDTGSFYFHMWSCCHNWFLKVSYIAASHFARSHSFRVTIPLDRLAPATKGVFFNLSCLLFAVLRNGAWEIVHWEKVCICFYFAAKEVHREVHFIDVTVYYYRQPSATPLIWRLFSS